jgi:hypothetical protein
MPYSVSIPNIRRSTRPTYVASAAGVTARCRQASCGPRPAGEPLADIQAFLEPDIGGSTQLAQTRRWLTSGGNNSEAVAKDSLKSAPGVSNSGWVHLRRLGGALGAVTASADGRRAELPRPVAPVTGRMRYPPYRPDAAPGREDQAVTHAPVAPSPGERHSGGGGTSRIVRA